MNDFISEHERYIKEALESKNEEDWKKLKENHYAHIKFLQHERLVHMLVTLFFGLFLSISLAILVFSGLMVISLLVIVLSVIEIFYMIHLFRLETGVQRWYVLYDDILSKELEE